MTYQPRPSWLTAFQHEGRRALERHQLSTPAASRAFERIGVWWARQIIKEDRSKARRRRQPVAARVAPPPR